MAKCRLVLASLLVGSFLVACSAEPWQDKDCTYWSNLSDSIYLSMLEAEQSGDADGYEWAKESYKNIQRDLPEICS